MKIVLDECVPQPLRHQLPGHTVVTAHFLGMNQFLDADLLDAIEGKFDVLITCDRGLPWQNRFAGRKIAVVVLKGQTNKLQDLLPMLPKILTALPTLKQGDIREITPP